MRLFFASQRPLAKSEPGDRSPRWQMLIPLNAERHRPDVPGGKLTFTEAFLASLERNFREMKSEYLGGDGFGVQMNYFHPDDDAPIESRIASGWIEDIKLVRSGPAGELGLWGLARLTERARAYLDADELRYLSPEIAFDPVNESTGKRRGPTLIGAALLLSPSFHELPRIAAAALPPADQATTGAHRMDKKMICACLGIAEDSSDEAVMTALKACCERAVKMSAEAEAVKLARVADATALTAAQEAAKLDAERVAKLTATVQEMQDAKFKSDVSALVTKLKTEGRIQAAEGANVEEVAAAMGIAKAEQFFGSRAPVVSLTEKGRSGAGEDGAPTEDQARVSYFAKVEEVQKLHSIPFAEATKRVNREHPELAKGVASRMNTTPPPKAN